MLYATTTGTSSLEVGAVTLQQSNNDAMLIH